MDKTVFLNGLPMHLKGFPEAGQEAIEKYCLVHVNLRFFQYLMRRFHTI